MHPADVDTRKPESYNRAEHARGRRGQAKKERPQLERMRGSGRARVAQETEGVASA